MSSTDDEILEVVDGDNNVTGMATRAEIHHRCLFHRAVHLFVFNRAGEIYVQRRSWHKDRFPGVLDSSAAGHVEPGESYENAAIRELREELRISCELKEVLRLRASEVTDHEHVVLYGAVTDCEPNPNPDEIQAGAFFKPEDLTAHMAGAPEDFVPVFIHLWQAYMREGN